MFFDTILNWKFSASLIAATTFGGALSAATLQPDFVLSSSLTVKVEEVARVEASNLGSPVAIDDDLYVIDQTGKIQRQTSTGFEDIFTPADAPAGITLGSNSAVLNIAGEGDTVYAVLRSSSVPTGTTINTLPSGYDGGLYDVVFKYDRDITDGSLSNPVPLTAFESTTTPGGHIGGGLLVLPGDKIAFARGDNTGFRADGLEGPQDNAETVGKIILIDGTTGETTVAASGVRNPQRMTFADDAKTQIAFADIGASTAEEINVISVSDLTDVATIENFGWGRNADGNAREGTFYINDGEVSNPGTIATAIGVAPVPEAGFVQPFAQFGREAVTGLFAVSGPVASTTSFDQIGLLFGDLVNGSLLATMAGATGAVNDVFKVNLQDALGNPLAFTDFNSGDRVDVRFFNFADGDAGVLLERTGQMFRITEVDIAAVPLPAGSVLLLSGLAALTLRSRRRQM